MSVDHTDELLNKQRKIFLELKNAHFSEPLDDNGYPTEGALDLISNWVYDDMEGWFDFIRNVWMPECRFIRRGNTIYLSTGGCSGNESIVQSMTNHRILWSLSWVSSRRGGHHQFIVL